MNYTYILLLITFIGFNISGFPLYAYLNNKVSNKTVKVTIIIALCHIIFYAIGISFIGDYIDYTLFAIEYLLCIILAFGIVSKKNWLLKIFGYAMFTIAVISTLFSIILGIFLFAVISQNYESDKVYNFESNGNSYQTRRYSYGFATLDEITYSFTTYRRFSFLPFEFEIDYSYFSDLQSDLDFNDPELLTLEVIGNGTIDQLRFTTHDNSFIKNLD
jgi:hypothetical protein